MDIVVKGRHTAVPERFRKHVQTKLAKLERLDPKAYRVDAELSREHNPRLSGIRERVELTVFSRGPVIRAEAAARDPYAALDAATAKLNERLRRAADKRCSHHNSGHHNGGHHNGGHHNSGHHNSGHHNGGHHNSGNHNNGNHRPDSVPPSAQVPPAAAPAETASSPIGDPAPAAALSEVGGYDDLPDASPMVVREKTHQAAPMTLDDALSNMELVGHDFYLFLDVSTGLPSVVYRRCGYDYGVIRLDPAADTSGDDPPLEGFSVGDRRPAFAVRSPAGRF